ncbi:hypothetical protein DIS18_01865 [Algibacter marinivivus]|uniref:DUF192 domain-containing protein n=2 Tax=Algibacter marinivivus TaxID=2100723 RepID=A0A2U2X6E2_9FLAO|nr:hypothetical protein DIS18_01865 [Algibacter marinivivus]
MFLKRYILLTVLFSLIFISCMDNKKAIKQTEITFTKEGELTIFKASDATQIHLDIEIADTDFDIQTGLMYRSSMEKKQGMLFVFEDERERFFYMKNTKIPLDLIYISSDTSIVSFQKNANPFDESSLPSNAPAKYVLEVNAGLVDTWGVLVGDRISFSHK